MFLELMDTLLSSTKSAVVSLAAVSLRLLFVDFSENELLLERGNDLVIMGGTDSGWEIDEVSIVGIRLVSDSFDLIAYAFAVCPVSDILESLEFWPYRMVSFNRFCESDSS